MMDILLDASGDLCISESGDLKLEDSVAQKIRIRLLWFEGEWRWDTEEGIPYFENLFVKNPDTDHFESLVRERIFEVEEVTEVKEVSVTYDRKTRDAVIRYTALTDFEKIREEVRIRRADRCLITE